MIAGRVARHTGMDEAVRSYIDAVDPAYRPLFDQVHELRQPEMQQLAGRGATMTEDEQRAFQAPILAKYDEEGSAYYSTARLWDDGILDPAETRDALGLALVAALSAPIAPTKFGVFRM